jgi:predicted alpha/beta-fold hydrolase
MIRMACHLLMQGYCVLRLNLRGAGDSRAVCGGQYYAGSSGDIRELVALLPPELTQHGIAAVGYSLGGAILLKYLGEEGSRAPICAAATVSAPIDLLGTCRTLMSFRNGLYHWYVFSRMKGEATEEGARLTCLERANIETSRTLWQYDDLFTAPRNGFRGAADYYAECSAVNFLSGIRTPTLLITSLDDPWVPGGAYSGYWRSNKSLSVQPLLSPKGGHVGFHGVGASHPWSDLAAAEFLANLA